jgi:BASS family bile acid:Na+ symporter
MFRFYPAVEYYLAALQLVLAMLGMGATLAVSDFRRVASTPWRAALGLALLFAVLPLAALAWSGLLGLPAGIGVGLLLVTAMPSGSISNLYTHLGRGSVPLAIAVTAVSTLLCLGVTPLVLESLAGSRLPAGFRMPAGRILAEIFFCLLVPLALGMALRRYAPDRAKVVSAWSLRGSLLALAAIVVGSLGSGRLQLAAFGWTAPCAILVLVPASQALAYALARLCRFGGDDAFALSMTVALRNTNLAVLLAASLFPPTAGAADPLAGGVLFAALFYGGAALAWLGCWVALRRAWQAARAGLPARQPPEAPPNRQPRARAGLVSAAPRRP